MAIPRHDAVKLTGDPFIDGLAQGGAWKFNGEHRLTFSFHVDPPDATVPWQWTTPRLSAMRDALTSWSNVANLHFTEVKAPADFTKSTADLAISLFSSPSNPYLAAMAIFPDPAFVNDMFAATGITRAQWPRAEGDIGINYASGIMSYIGHGAFGYNVLIHEIGHALGLKQPFDDGGNGRPTFDELAIPEMDSSYRTVMSYEVLNPASPYIGHVQTPMMLDILAIQHIYGANTSYHKGNDSYRLVDSTVSTIWDAGGHDTLDARALREGVTLDLAPGTLNRFGALGAIGIAYHVTLEDARGSSHDDVLLGNLADNRLLGGAGNDTLDGGAGNDTLDGGPGIDVMRGGSGDDTYTMDQPGDQVIEQPGEGNDTVVIGIENTSSAPFLVSLNPDPPPLIAAPSAGLIGVVLGAPAIAHVGMFADATLVFHDIENLRVTGAGVFDLQGDDGPNHLTGNGSANTLFGLGGNDVLDGGAGADVLIGGAGDDIYVVDQPADVIVEAPDAGIDTVYSFINWSLAALPDVENLTLTGSANARALGNDADNILRGNAGNNVLNGFAGNDYLDGGHGQDRMYGGPGDDVYIVDDGHDRVVEGVGGGIDTVRSSVSYTLGGELENLVLLGHGTLNGTGNALANGLTGNTGNNVLTGLGGADLLDGAGGNDQLFGGAGDDVLHGGAGNDILQGDAGNDVLDGGSGTDRMIGGRGDDQYGIDSTGDRIVEDANAGTDTVISSITYTLGANLENLTLVGARDIAGTGNARANVLIGNDGANVLNGQGGADVLDGGAGNDTLDGGAGSDRLNGGEGDDILRFDPADLLRDGGAGHDQLRFDDGHVVVDLAGQAGVTCVGIDAVALGNGNTLELTSNDVLSMTDAGTLFVTGGESSRVDVLDSGWTAGADVDQNGIHYHVYTSGTASLYVDDQLTVGIA